MQSKHKRLIICWLLKVRLQIFHPYSRREHVQQQFKKIMYGELARDLKDIL